MSVLRAAWLLPALVACGGPSAAEIKEARESVYQADRAVVWQALHDEMHERFPDADSFKVESEEGGYIETKWKAVESSQDSTVGESNATRNQSAGALGARTMFRMLVKMEGGPPWKLYVDGEAAAYRPDAVLMTPFPHGSLEEPQWVGPRVENVRASLHARLKQYAVKLPSAR